MIRPVQVEARDGYKIWVKFDDGVEGEVDLSNLVSRGGLFKSWEDREFFELVSVADYNAIKWGEGGFHELCGDSLYMKITGLTAREFNDRSKQQVTHA